LWRICLEGEPEFSKTCLKMSDDWYPSFEMYGYRNPHMVVYEKPITFSHLCMIGQGEHAGCIEAPYTAEFPHTNPPVKSMTSGKQLTAFYNELRDTAHKVNKGKTEYGTLESEGYVIYAKNSDGLRLFKVKPEEVEDIAWSRGEVIKPHTISATCWNALEHTDDVTLEVVNQLLLEEYSQDAIDRYESRIKKVFWEVRALQKIQERALVLYRQLPKDVQSGGKGGVMRSIMPGFNKKESTAVYNALRISGIFD